MLNEWIDDFSNLLFLISLILCLKLSIIDIDQGSNRRPKGRETICVHVEDRCWFRLLRRALVLTTSMILIVSTSWTTLSISWSSLYLQF